jgi:hypothetical protein
MIRSVVVSIPKSSAQVAPKYYTSRARPNIRAKDMHPNGVHQRHQRCRRDDSIGQRRDVELYALARVSRALGLSSKCSPYCRTGDQMMRLDLWHLLRCARRSGIRRPLPATRRRTFRATADSTPTNYSAALGDHRERLDMRRILPVLVICLLELVASTEAIRAEITYPWCAQYARDGRNCGFWTYQQCMATVWGTGGYCDPTPCTAHHPGKFPRPELRQRPSY